LWREDAEESGFYDSVGPPLDQELAKDAAIVPFDGVQDEYSIGGLNPSPRRH
jgi:hypothetical protein